MFHSAAAAASAGDGRHYEEVGSGVAHLLVGQNRDNDEQVADEARETDCTEHQRQHDDRLPHNEFSNRNKSVSLTTSQNASD